MRKRLATVDHLAGHGLLLVEGSEAVPVSYRLHIQREMITPMRGDLEIGGVFDVSGSVETDKPFPSLNFDAEYDLELADGTRVGIFISHGTIGSTHYRIGIRSANELMKRYEANEG